MTAAGIDRAGTGKVRYNHVDLQINRAERPGPDDLHHRRAALTRTGAAPAKTWNPETVIWTYSGARFALPLIPIPKDSVTLTESFRVERVRPSAGFGNWRNIQRPSGCYGNGRNPYEFQPLPLTPLVLQLVRRPDRASGHTECPATPGRLSPECLPVRIIPSGDGSILMF